MRGLQNKDLDFVRAAHAKQKMSSKQKKRNLAIAFPVLLIVMIGGMWGFLAYQYTTQAALLGDYTTQVSTLGADEKYLLATEMEGQIATLEEEAKCGTEIRNAMDSFPDVSKEIFQQIRACEIPTVTTQRYAYDAETGTLTIEGKAKGVKETALFVRKLRNTGLFIEVDYSGYVQEMKASEALPLIDEAGNMMELPPVPTGKYIFTFTGVLKGRAA